MKGTIPTKQGGRASIYCAERTAIVCGAVTINGNPVNCRRVAVSRSASHEKAALESGLYAIPIAGYPGYFLLLADE